MSGGAALCKLARETTTLRFSVGEPVSHGENLYLAPRNRLLFSFEKRWRSDRLLGCVKFQEKSRKKHAGGFFLGKNTVYNGAVLSKIICCPVKGA